MAYTKATDFAAKDALLTGNPAKIVKGTELDAEFNAISTDLNADTGSGNLVRASSPTLATPTLTSATLTSPTMTTPTLGVATATSVNGLALTGATGTYNVGVGTSALFSLDAGATENVAIGRSAGFSIFNGDYNVAVGALSMQLCDGAVSATTAYGYYTLRNVSGVSNTACGYIVMDAVTSGERNTAIGSTTARTLVTGSNNSFLGYSAEPSSASVSNEITLGNSSIATLRCQVTSITSLSDARDKTDIAPLTTGLSTVMALNPVRFTWNMRDGGKIGIKDAGFIAQDLQTVDDDWLRLVYAENPEKLEASYGRLIPVLVKAIQELKEELDDLRLKM